MAFGCLMAAEKGPKAKGPAREEAVRVGDNILLYQRGSGGWPKNIDMARRLSEADKAKLRRDKNRTDSTLDNGATHTQMRQLGRLYAATKQERFKAGFIKAVDYVLEAQYPNGGWPQFYPGPRGYSAHITFNDGAMIGAMSILRDIAQKRSVYGFVDEPRRKKAGAAVAKGIECTLKCQIVVNGKRTVWCAQHDQKTLEPRPARIYEKVSLSGNESVDVVRFLMSIDKPSPKVIQAIEGAVAWFDGPAKITGIRQITKPDKTKPRGIDKVIVKDPKAPPIWARFYDIKTNRPIFCGRDGVIKKTLAEINPERRTGYSWYGYYPAALLARDYPAWRKKHPRL
jgi:PelA/Pel-15E family pectate lyase